MKKEQRSKKNVELSIRREEVKKIWNYETGRKQYTKIGTMKKEGRRKKIRNYEEGKRGRRE
jgi:hypothetical protein